MVTILIYAPLFPSKGIFYIYHTFPLHQWEVAKTYHASQAFILTNYVPFVALMGITHIISLRSFTTNILYKLSDSQRLPYLMAITPSYSCPPPLNMIVPIWNGKLLLIGMRRQDHPIFHPLPQVHFVSVWNEPMTPKVIAHTSQTIMDGKTINVLTYSPEDQHQTCPFPSILIAKMRKSSSSWRTSRFQYMGTTKYISVPNQLSQVWIFQQPRKWGRLIVQWVSS